MRALAVDVFRTPIFKGCSNHGISERFDKLLIQHDRGNVEIDENDPPENFCKVVTRTIAGRVHKHIEPYKEVDAGYVGWMSGGSYAATSDGRFSEISDYPLSIHDRQETAEQYERMSR